MRILPSAVEQGDVCVVVVSNAGPLKSVQGEFLGVEFPLAPAAGQERYQALLGIDLDTKPGIYALKIIGASEGRNVLKAEVPLSVEGVNFPTQRLTLPPSMVELDQKTLERVTRESGRLKALFRDVRGEMLWEGAFVRPVDGDITTAFGLRRLINGLPRSPHTGVDLRAPEGTPVLACNTGIVVLVDTMFFSGKSVVLDHGRGMFSMYFHLSEILVREAERVMKGTVIGRSGSTGRATGPHLHWGIRLNGSRVDPLSLIELADHLEE